MKMLKNWGSLGKKREGFTLIELLIVMVILAILAGIVIISIGGVIGRGHATAYNADAEQIEAAVAEFMTRPTDATYNHVIGQVPVGVAGTLNGAAGAPAPNISGPGVIQTATGEIYYVVAICPLLTSSFPQGILKNVPPTVNSINQDATGGAGVNANAEVGVDTNCVDGDNGGSYGWYTTLTGDVASVCLHATDCANTGMNGFQDVYP
jgi:prepilin-type N-terminal cleavage/methylation domain-containing protein